MKLCGGVRQEFISKRQVAPTAYRLKNAQDAADDTTIIDAYQACSAAEVDQSSQPPDQTNPINRENQQTKQ
jgi:hypothetical protein